MRKHNFEFASSWSLPALQRLPCLWPKRKRRHSWPLNSPGLSYTTYISKSPWVTARPQDENAKCPERRGKYPVQSELLLSWGKERNHLNQQQIPLTPTFCSLSWCHLLINQAEQCLSSLLVLFSPRLLCQLFLVPVDGCCVSLSSICNSRCLY